MKITPISAPLPGEHLAATFPVLRPETDEKIDWRLRLSFWAGRALTAEALELEQKNRAGRLAWRGRVASAGVIHGLEVAIEAPPPLAPITTLAGLKTEGLFIHILPGHGLLPNGEDIVVPRPLRIPLNSIPVLATIHDDLTAKLARAASAPAGTAPWAAVLIAAPAEFRMFKSADPNDPCELDPSKDPFADERRADACAFVLLELPQQWQSRPELVNRGDLRWRNLLAHAIFAEERAMAARQQTHYLPLERDTERWASSMRGADVPSWEMLGVPIALFSAERQEDGAWAFFLDHGSVVRPGGLARFRSRPALQVGTDKAGLALNPPGAGTPLNWRAQIDQLTEHIGQLDTSTEAAVQALDTRFRFVPPTGFLPRAVLSLLTTEQALALPLQPNQPPDRAGINHFFPPSFSVDAVPVSMEDLDAALAAGAGLEPYDFDSGADYVQMLVPLPERSFDPKLLVVEQEDPVFKATVNRFVSDRQDWRQRRDFVRNRRDTLETLANGPKEALPALALEGGQVEPEPVQASDPFAQPGALFSPKTATAPWELIAPFAPQSVRAATTLFLLLRVEQDSVPKRIESRWRRGAEEFSFSWTELPPAPDETADANGNPLASSLWRRFTVTGEQLGVASGELTGFTLRIESGEIGIACGGQILATGVQQNWWTAAQTNPAPSFKGGEWTKIHGERLLAPFEAPYIPLFPDRRSTDLATSELDFRINEIEEALNPEGATARTTEVTIDKQGLQRALIVLEAEAQEADDFVDMNFTRAQVNLYRIRKLVLGENAAQKLLINPAIAVIADEETFTASSEKFSSFIAEAKGKTTSKKIVNAALSPPTITSISPSTGNPGTTFNATITGANLKEVTDLMFTGADVEGKIAGNSTDTEMTVTVKIAVGAPLGQRSVTLFVEKLPFELKETFTVAPPQAPTRGFGGRAINSGAVAILTDALPRADIFEMTSVMMTRTIKTQGPESGPTLPPRGLSIGERFKEPLAARNLSYARAALVDLLNRLPSLRLPLLDHTVQSLRGESVRLLDLQGRSKERDSQPTSTLRTNAVNSLLKPVLVTNDTDEAEVTLAALDFTEMKSAILRTIERIIQERRAVIATGQETLTAILACRNEASARILAIEGKLAEARQDVSVARALRQEEQQRIAEINKRRDGLIRDEVKFLAYTRPRTVNLVRRTSAYWRLEAFGAPAPVPACLQRHDEAPAALGAYVRLFRYAPARWFPAMAPLLAKLDTADKVIGLLESVRLSANSFATLDSVFAIRNSAEAVQFTVMTAHRIIGATRQDAGLVQVASKSAQRWTDFQRDASRHAAVGDLISDRHGSSDVSAAAAEELDRIGQVGTCLHAEFAAAPASVRLAWVERFSQFDRPVLLRDLTVLPHYGQLERSTRRRLQEFVDWLFGRVHSSEQDAMNLMNDLVRLCLLLASHAPVNRILIGHVPRPTPVRPGIQIPIRPLNPEGVRVGMEFHVWQASQVVAKGRVEDLQSGEVTARVEHVEAQTTTIDSTMRVQFVSTALSLKK